MEGVFRGGGGGGEQGLLLIAAGKEARPGFTHQGETRRRPSQGLLIRRKGNGDQARVYSYLSGVRGQASGFCG
jgi:hypothetical protein